jgi:hypothetical protein
MINITSIKKYINDPIQNHQLVPIRYTKKEQNLIDNLNINKDIMFNYYGNKYDIDNKKLNTFIDNLGSNNDINLDVLYNLIMKLLNKITKAFNTDYIWLAIRVTLATDDYNIKRWHKDAGKLFSQKRAYPYKFVTILKGPGTLFFKNSKQVNLIYENNIKNINDAVNKLENKQLYNGDDDEITLKYRKKLQNKLKNYKHKQLKNNEGLIFSIGDYGTLHSEPKKDVPRFFISILPCTEIEINELIKRRDIKELTSITIK